MEGEDPPTSPAEPIVRWPVRALPSTAGCRAIRSAFPATAYRRAASGESGAVLAALLAARPDLRDHAEQLARAQLTDVDPDAVAAEVVDVYLDQSVLDIGGGRAGRQRHRGYVHEADAQWELLEEALEPFLAEIDRLGGLGMHEAATNLARGTLARLDEDQASAGPAIVPCRIDRGVTGTRQRGGR